MKGSQVTFTLVAKAQEACIDGRPAGPCIMRIAGMLGQPSFEMAVGKLLQKLALDGDCMVSVGQSN